MTMGENDNQTKKRGVKEEKSEEGENAMSVI